LHEGILAEILQMNPKPACLYDECSLHSVGRFHWLSTHPRSRGDFEYYIKKHHYLQPGGLWYQSVQQAIAYRDADPRQRRRIDARRKKEREALLASLSAL
jgi:hypothetical protein